MEREELIPVERQRSGRTLAFLLAAAFVAGLAVAGAFWRRPFCSSPCLAGRKGVLLCSVVPREGRAEGKGTMRMDAESARRGTPVGRVCAVLVVATTLVGCASVAPPREEPDADVPEPAERWICEPFEGTTDEPWYGGFRTWEEEGGVMSSVVKFHVVLLLIPA